MRPGRAADHSPPSSSAVIEEYSYTSTHPLGYTGPVRDHFTFNILLLTISTSQTSSLHVMFNGEISVYISNFSHQCYKPSSFYPPRSNTPITAGEATVLYNFVL